MDKLNDIVLGYDEKLVLKEKQSEVLLHLLNKKGDLIVNLPVGYGKSIIFHLLPKLLDENVFKPVVIVVSALNIIQKDQLVSLKSHNISSCRLDIYSNIDDDGAYGAGEDNDRFTCTSDASIDQLKRGDISVVLCHPEALLDTKKGRKILKSLLQQHVVAIVTDECHVLDQWSV
ncbi:hypothetical protein DPMN_010496 [Dreissena polymorpha]|uniref:DNA 3'-5' helicase n=1 Tax=Dreissena polymorpha TaxID=45954 RepID=A0A9D4RZA7_DREPO|nr:hypothetical protein DPMN_010496 [Dreissena polymorpha]